MGIMSYVESLLPRFGSDRLIEDSRLSGESLKTNAIASWKFAKNGLKTFKSDEANEIVKSIAKSLKISPTSFCEDMAEKLEAALANHETIQKAIEDNFDDEVIVEGIGCKKATIIQIVELFGFVGDYSLKLLEYLYYLETRVLDPGHQSSLTPAEVGLIMNRQMDFCQSLNALSMAPNKFKATLDSIPDISLSKGAEPSLRLAGVKADNPFSLGFVNTDKVSSWNFIYHIGLFVAQYQANVYKRRVETRRILELRLLNLERLQKGNPDPSTQKQIDYMRQRIETLNALILKDEK